MAHHRPERVAELVHGELSRLLHEEAADPRLSAVSITEVRLSADLRVARVYFLPMGGLREPVPTSRALAGAAGWLRGRLARSLQLRYTPELRFVDDRHTERAIRVTSLIDSLEIGGEE